MGDRRPRTLAAGDTLLVTAGVRAGNRPAEPAPAGIVTVPNVVGWSASEAATAILAEGLVAPVIDDSCNDVGNNDIGNVVSQSPPPAPRPRWEPR